MKMVKSHKKERREKLKKIVFLLVFLVLISACSDTMVAITSVGPTDEMADEMRDSVVEVFNNISA